MAEPTPTPTPSAQTSRDQTISSSMNIFKTFTQHITIKLDELNYLSWKQQVEGIVKTYKFQCYLVNPKIPPCYLTVGDRTKDSENHEYRVGTARFTTVYMASHYTICFCSSSCCLLCSCSPSLGSNPGLLKSRELRNELMSITKGEETIMTFFVRIYTIADSLESIRDPISLRDQVEAILDGLLGDYNEITSVIQNRNELCPIITVEVTLLSREARLDRLRRRHLLTYVYQSYASVARGDLVRFVFAW